MTILTDESNAQLTQRKYRGDLLLTTAWARKVEGEDRDSAAADAISDILTAMFGRAGDWGERDGDGVGVIRYNALTNAALLVQKGFDSYKGDAEDYVIEQ